MPTLPLPLMTNLSVVPRAVEEAIENMPLETSSPIVHAPAVAPPENSNADLVAEYILKRLFGVVVPMPTLPLEDCTMKCEPPTVKPPVEMVEVAEVEVALKLPKVGVEVATRRPEELVERRELTAGLFRVSEPSKRVEPWTVKLPPR